MSGCCKEGVLGRAYCGLYEALCCPDPCYDPQWCAVADAAFHVAAAVLVELPGADSGGIVEFRRGGLGVVGDAAAGHETGALLLALLDVTEHTLALRRVDERSGEVAGVGGVAGCGGT